MTIYLKFQNVLIIFLFVNSGETSTFKNLANSLIFLGVINFLMPGILIAEEIF